MYKTLINKALEEIRKITDENFFVSFKGFPVDFIQEISNTIPFYTATSILFDDDKINLDGILNANKLVRIETGKEGGSLLLYEEITQLQKYYLGLSEEDKNSLMPNYKDIKFYIFENNHLVKFPNQSNQTCFDLDDNIEEKPELKETEVFNEFYSYSSYSGDLHLVQYLEIEFTPNFVSLDFFANTPQAERVTEFSCDDSDSSIEILSQEYEDLKCNIYLGNAISVSCVLTNKFTKSLDSDADILSYILEKNNVNITICKKELTTKNTYRPELLSIFQEYWKTAKHPEPQFRNLHFYENPETDLNKVEYSQGAIAEVIVRESENALNKKAYKNIFLTAPTGSGKSVLYQVPALYLSQKQDLVTIVIVPLIALMEDAVTGLKKRGVDNCAYINSSLSYAERVEIVERLQNGGISILFLSPELFISFGNLSFLGNRKLGLLVIDEAHTVSTWGQEFRADYWNLGNHIYKLKKYDEGNNFPIVAMTATATFGGKKDMVSEIIERLKIERPQPIIFIGNVRRDYISFNINKFEPSEAKTYEIQKKDKTKEYIVKNVNNKIKSLVYFPWVRTNNEVYSRVPSKYMSEVVQYHGRLFDDDKKAAIHDFSNNLATTACVTKAFGMGIDIPDIQQVYHFAPSGSLTDYIQEIGRLRNEVDDNGNSTIKHAVVDYCEDDLSYNKRLFFFSAIKQYEIRLALTKINSIYEKKRKTNPALRNFLVSVDDFYFITGVNDEDRIKRMLLMIEHDFHPYLIVRPKSLFSTVYGLVPDTIRDAFLEKYGAYCIDTHERKKNTGSIYQIELNKIWGQFFPTLTFPQVKKEFYAKKLFAEWTELVYPNLKLSIKLTKDYQVVLDEITGFLEAMSTIFRSLGRHYFDKDEFTALLKKHIPDDDLRVRIVNNILMLFTKKQEVKTKERTPLAFLTMRFFGTQKKYLVQFNDFRQIKQRISRRLNDLLSSKSDDISSFVTSNQSGNAMTIRILYLLEIMQLGTYELSGSEKTQIFIRVNEPEKLQSTIRNIKEYSNSFIVSQNKQFERNNEIFHSFFSKEQTDEERWSFIENYFLGNVTVTDSKK